MMYDLQYKCRLCGGIESIGSMNSNKQEVFNMLSRIMMMEPHMNGLTGDKKMTVIHNCNDGSTGIADLIGAKLIK